MAGIAKIGTPTSLSTGIASPQAFNHTLVAGERRVVAVTISSVSNTQPIYSVTYGGVSMTKLVENWESTPKMTQAVFYIQEVDLPADGVNSVSVSWTGGTSHTMSVTCDSIEDGRQNGPPAVEYASITNSATITTNLDSPALSWRFAMTSHDVGFRTFTHSNSQVEIREESLNPFSNATCSTIYVGAEVSSFVTTASGTTSGTAMQASHMVIIEDLGADFEATITATSIITADLFVPTDFDTTISAVSTVSGDLLRNRGFETSVAAISAVTGDVIRQVDLTSVTNVISTVTPDVARNRGFNTVVVSTSSITGALAGVIRLFESTTTVVSDIEVAFGNTFDENISSLTPGCYVELFIIDTTVIGGGDVFRFIPHGYEISNVMWQGEEYLRFPIQIDGFEWNATSQAPPQPTLSLSNVNDFVAAAVITLGDIVGAQVTRYRTYQQYLDGEDQADQNAHFPPDIFFVQQKTAHNKEFIEWTLSSALDLPGVRLPLRQVLRDETVGNLYAPGVSQVRFRGR